MRKLLRYMRRNEWIMAAVCALLILGQIYFDLSLPDYMSSLTVLIKTPGTTMDEILRTGLEMLGCTLASAALCVLCGYLTAKVAAGFSYSIRESVFNKIADFGQQEMMAFSVPSLINRTTNDITQVQTLTSMGLQILIKAPVMAVWAIIKIVNKSWTLSAITAGFVLALLAMMALIIGIVAPRFRRVQKLTDHLNLVARENLNGINVVHAYNAEEYQNEKFKTTNETLMKTQLFNQRAFAFLMPSVTLAMNALSLTIYWVGAAIVNNVPAADAALRLTTFSDIVVFGTYATYVIMTLMMLVMIIMLMPAAQVSAQRINEVLEARTTLKPGARTESPEVGTVEFRNVSFHYPSSDKNVLENISFTAKRGETVAFIGATGSGKTTLVSLAARFYDATAGEVLVDGANVRDYTFDALYDRIGYVTQKAILFSGDICENVLFGDSRGEASEEAVRQALDLAQASEFVQKLPGGIHAPLAEGGTNVSGGQKQRLSIARALARKPEILVFDDSFSALDYRTDAKLRAGLARQLKDTTRLIVAQRIGTIRDADKIIVLDEGRMVGMGTHEELLKTCPVYQEIARSQLSSEELGAQERRKPVYTHDAKQNERPRKEQARDRRRAQRGVPLFRKTQGSRGGRAAVRGPWRDPDDHRSQSPQPDHGPDLQRPAGGDQPGRNRAHRRAAAAPLPVQRRIHLCGALHHGDGDPGSVPGHAAGPFPQDQPGPDALFQQGVLRRHPQPRDQRRQHSAAGPGQQPALHDQRRRPVPRVPGDDVCD